MKKKSDTTFTSIEQLNAATSEYVRRYLAGLTQEKLEAILDEYLEKQLLSVCAQAAGFTNHWNEWEVMHTNGRESTITELCSEAVKAKFRAAMDELITTPTITKMWSKALKNELETQMGYVLRDRARERAEDILQEHLDLAAKELLGAMVKTGPHE